MAVNVKLSFRLFTVITISFRRPFPKISQ